MMAAMIMQLEGMSGEEIVNLELATGVPIVYKLDPATGKVVSKEVLKRAFALFGVLKGERELTFFLFPPDE